MGCILLHGGNLEESPAPFSKSHTGEKEKPGSEKLTLKT